MFRLLLVALFTMAAASVRADTPAAPKPAADSGSTEFEAKFVDGSTVKVILLDTTVNITTKYGKLTLPVSDIRRVEVGFRYPPGVEAKVDAEIANLEMPSFRAREDAEKALVEFGEFAVPSLRRARLSTNPEVKRRVDSVWKKLQAKLPAEKFDLKDYDVVEAEFPIRGRLDPASLKIRSKYFGEGEMKLAEVRAIRLLAAPVAVASIELDAAKYAKIGWTTWLDTGVDVSTEAPVNISVTGQIDLWPQEAGRYLSGPQGGNGQAPGTPGNRPIIIPGAAMAGPQNIQNMLLTRGYVPSGAVVGKVGAEGQPFLVGASYKETKAPAAGRLFLIIAPSYRGNQECSGSYQVKIKPGE